MTNPIKEPNDFFDFGTPIETRELFKVIFERKISILVFSLLLSIISFFYALSLTDYYKSESLMSIRDSNKNQTAAQIGGAASLLGIDISTSSEDNSMLAIELIKSRKFIKHLLTFDKVLPSIMAAKNFDKKTKTLIFDSNIYDSDKNIWIKQSDSIDPEPSYLDTHAVFNEDLLTISLDKNSGFIKLSIEHVSPIFAKDLINLIIEEANNILRIKDLSEAELAIKFLKSEISRTSLIDIKDSINRLIEAQLEIQMMSNINKDYVLVMIDPPYIPKKSIGNSKSLIVVFTFIFGFLISSIFILIRFLLFKRT